MVYTQSIGEEIGLLQLILGRIGNGRGLQLRMMLEDTKPWLSDIAGTTSSRVICGRLTWSLIPESDRQTKS